MAADVTEVHPAVITPGAGAPEKTAPPQPHRFRFLLLYVALAGVVGAAVAGIVLLAGTSSGPASSGWSSWKPKSAGDAGVKQIVSHVSSHYKLDTGLQLIDVIAKAPAVQDIPIHAVAVRGSGGRPDQISLIDSGNSLMFVLCGLGPACSIATGAATVERGRLVRREALELALYTFKYIGNVKYIVAFMPPKKGAQAKYVVYFNKSDLNSELHQPLERTLDLRTPRSTTIPPNETVTIDRLTTGHEFQFQLQQAQQGDAILVLTAL